MVTKTQVVISLVLWFAIATIMFNALGEFIGDDDLIQEQKSKGLLGFSFNIFSSISIMPVWFNSVIFGSLGVIVSWIILSSLAPSGQ